MQPVQTYTDKEVITILQSSESPERIVRYLYRTQFKMSRAYILKNNGLEADAEDIFQEVLLTVIELIRLNKFRGESSLSTFFYSVTRNTWLNELKKRGRSRLRDQKFSLASAATENDSGDDIVRRELRQLMLDVVDSLGETCKTILIAIYYEYQSVAEILQILPYENEQVVRNKKYKCLKQLEEMLHENPRLAQNLKAILHYE